MYISFIIFFIIFSLILAYYCKKNNLIVDYKFEKHKRFSSTSKSNSIGGILLIVFLFYEFIFISQNYYLLLFLFSIFFIGFMSDIKKLNKVSLRFFLQIILIVFFIEIIGIEIKSTSVEYLDLILDNSLGNIVFVCFCLMVLINGGNFIDGLNGLLLKYYLLIFLVIFLNFGHYTNLDSNFLINLIIILTIILLLNLFGVIYMGDSGAYLLSLFTGVYLINFSFNNNHISPFLIVVLLWYPCFELLFSMIRRFVRKSKTYKPDTGHLHQFIFNFFKKKFKYKNTIMHFVTSFLINFYNLLIFMIAINFIYNSKILIFIIIFNIFLYTLFYMFFKKKSQTENN